MNDLLQYGWQHILDGQGLGIAFTGMSIVFLTLTAISFCIALLPRITALFGNPPQSQPTTSESEASRDAQAAAIGYTLDYERHST